MKMTKKETAAYNRALETAAKISGNQVMQIVSKNGRTSTYYVGEAIAKLILKRRLK